VGVGVAFYDYNSIFEGRTELMMVCVMFYGVYILAPFLGHVYVNL